MLDLQKLTDIYKKFGFIQEKSENSEIAVYSIKTGHYHNADIVPLKNNLERDEINKIFDAYKASGYACKIRDYTSNEDAHKILFNGFFTATSTKDRLKKEYINFTESIVKIHSEDATYSYIKSKYNINSVEGDKSVIDEILNRLNEKKPVLFLIEAAAGFGKTCTAYELLSHLLDCGDKVPLFTELSRNRQAKIFRYVLLDEIDRSFPLLSSSLVRNEIKTGNVPVILDGFDELLHESNNDESSNYENTEPMLETISELLTNNAKIVLTTRRTAIFDGDEFHQWILSHELDFEVIRIRIHEPSIEDWLQDTRYNEILSTGFPISKLSNPVLLSFLRCISIDDFNKVIIDPTQIVKKYFNSMLERERTRQDLLMSVEDQYNLLKSIADDMIEYNYTSESREYICIIIAEKHQVLLEETRKLYKADQRPTTDELVNKLASHALLDRSGNESQEIGFVNEFVLGNYVADNILNDKTNEWVGDKRFIEPAVQSYIPRSDEDKFYLWDSLKFSLNFMSGYDKIHYSNVLQDSIILDIEDDIVEQLNISKIALGNKNKLISSVFIDCHFYNSTFHCDNLKNITFVNSSFTDCDFHNLDNRKDIYFLGCSSNNMVFESNTLESEYESDDKIDDCDIYILEKFYPKGSAGTHKHRPIKALCAKNNYFQLHNILTSISKLKREGFLLTPDKRSFLELNMDRISDIKTILGKV